MYKSKRAWAVSCFILATIPGLAFGEGNYQGRWQDWDVTIGAGAIYEPVSPGIDEYETSPVPFIDIEYLDRYFLKTGKGLGAYLLRSEGAREYGIGIALGLEGGRDEDDAKEQLDGLGDLDDTIEARIFAEGGIGPVDIELELAQGLGGHEGFRAELGASMDYAFNDNLMVEAGPGIAFADSNYMESFYGITAAQANRSTRYSTAYEAGSGFESAGFEAGMTYQFNKHWVARGVAEYTWLLGDASDSPVVDDDGFMSFGALVAYRF